MEERKRNELETKLKKMLKDLDEAEKEQKERRPLTGTGNFIRRRAGERDKRFSV